MGQHKRPDDHNKRPNTHTIKRPLKYLSFGRIQHKPTPTSLASKIKSLRANDKESR